MCSVIILYANDNKHAHCSMPSYAHQFFKQIKIHFISMPTDLLLMQNYNFLGDWLKDFTTEISP